MLLPNCLLLLIASSLAAEKCGYLGSRFVNKRLSAIIGGQEINALDVPWVVRIDGPEGLRCTGTLVSDRHVITAAHCFVPTSQCSENLKDSSDFTVCYKEDMNNKKCSKDRELGVKEIHFLDRWTSSSCNREFDIALVELDRPVLSGTPICVPDEDTKLDYESHGNSTAHVLGYSDNDDLEENPADRNTHLKHSTTHVNLVHNYRFSGGTFIISAYDERMALCGGDSGGPMFEIHDKKAVLIGVNVATEGDCVINRVIPWRPKPEQRTVELKQHLELIAKILLERGIELN